jgi:serine protease Do
MKRCLLVLTCLALGGSGVYVGQSFLQGQAPVNAGGRAVAVPKELTSYRDIVKKVAPAVVSIEAQARGRARLNQRPDDMRLPPGADLFGGRARRIDDEDSPSRIGFGSGFLISPKGVILTNNHVVAGAEQVVVQLSDGRKFTSKQIKTDPMTDLAIVTVESKLPLPFLEMGDSSEMEVGDRVLAVGAPFGLTGTVTHGIISNKGGVLGKLEMNRYNDFLQTDAAINPGNSGGPLINLEGKVIGINSAIKSRTGGFQGIGLAISSNLGKWVADQLLANGSVKRGYLGVALRDVSEEGAKELGLKEARGVRIMQVLPDAPGERAGLKNGDVILSMQGKPIQNRRVLQMLVARLPVGKPVELIVFRDGAEKTMKVTIDEQPKDFATPKTSSRVPVLNLPAAGIAVTELTADLAEELGFPETVKGVLIVRVAADGLAAQAGLRAGMVILSANKTAVTTPRELAEVIKEGSTSTGITLRARTARGAAQTFVLKAKEGE